MILKTKSPGRPLEMRETVTLWPIVPRPTEKIPKIVYQPDCRGEIWLELPTPKGLGNTGSHAIIHT